MDNFRRLYDKVALRTLHAPFKPMQRCKIEYARFKQKDLLLEYNQSIYPVSKNLLSMLIGQAKSHGWRYVHEFGFGYIADLIKSSENLSKCKFDIKKIEEYRSYRLLFICLPYKIDIWKEQLSKYFDEKTVLSLFRSFGNAVGVSGTYSNGQLVIVNSGRISSQKDAEEIVEHELIHMLEYLDETENAMSKSMEQILASPNEVKAYAVNLVNSLEAAYDHITASRDGFKDSPEMRKEFLDKLFLDADVSESEDDLYGQYSYAGCSSLLRENLWFLWRMSRWRPDEFLEFKRKIYEEFIY